MRGREKIHYGLVQGRLPPFCMAITFLSFYFHIWWQLPINGRTVRLFWKEQTLKSILSLNINNYYVGTLDITFLRKVFYLTISWIYLLHYFTFILYPYILATSYKFALNLSWTVGIVIALNLLAFIVNISVKFIIAYCF